MNRKSVILFLGEATFFVVFGVVLFLIIMFYKDPLYLFHGPKSEKFHLEGNMRLQAAGIINSFEFDSLILGTSMLENTSANFCSNVIGGKFINISLSGSSFWERAFVLEYALKKKKIVNVIYSLDMYYITCWKKSRYNPDNWIYLYDDKILNDFKAYLHKNYIKGIFLEDKSRLFADLDMPNKWMDSEYNKCRFGGLQNWIAHKEKQGLENILMKEIPYLAIHADPDIEICHDEEKEKKAYSYFEDTIFRIAAEHRETYFHLIFPPYWRYRYAEMRQYTIVNFSLHQEIIRYVVKRAEQLGNVSVYGFEDCSFVDDIARYKDYTHYDADINIYITESIRDRKHLLTQYNVESYLTRCDDLARAFDFKALDRKVKGFLSTSKI